MRARLAALLALLAATAAVAASALGPGDPTTVFVDGFTSPCRASFGPDGSLYVVDFGDRAIHRVTPDGSSSVFSSEIGDPRGITFDAFGNLIVPDRDNGRVHRIAPDGTITPFLQMFRPIRARVGPNGDVWIAAIDSVHHFDAMGRHIEGVDVRSQGVAAYGLQFNPDGDLYITNWGGFGILADGVVTPLDLGLMLRAGAPHFDTSGHAYWVHEAVEEGDTHRVLYADQDLAVLDESFASLDDGPCAHVFGRDTNGETTNDQYVGLRNGTIVKLNSAGAPLPGVSETGLQLTDLAESEVAAEILGQDSQVTDDQAYFLDVIGNHDGAYDVGDFRAYLVATGTID